MYAASDYTGNQDSFLSFRCGLYNLVIPLCDIAAIETSLPEKVRAINTEGCSGGFIITGDKNMPLAIGADEIFGLVSIASVCQYELPCEVRTCDNGWICAAAHIDNTDDGYTALMIDSRLLARQCYTKDNPQL